MSKSSRLPKGGGSIRKRADGRWEGRYSMGFDPETGKQIQRSLYRDIILGEQDEPVYETTNNSEIAFAFREAGEAIGS